MAYCRIVLMHSQWHMYINEHAFIMMRRKPKVDSLKALGISVFLFYLKVCFFSLLALYFPLFLSKAMSTMRF